MPRYIIKLNDERANKDYYLEWSTVVDAPVTYGMSLDEFKKFYKEEYGPPGMHDLPDRLSRVEKKGTSAHLYQSVDALLEYNRAGEKETHLDKEGILEKYCRNKKTITMNTMTIGYGTPLQREVEIEAFVQAYYKHGRAISTGKNVEGDYFISVQNPQGSGRSESQSLLLTEESFVGVMTSIILLFKHIEVDIDKLLKESIGDKSVEYTFI